VEDLPAAYTWYTGLALAGPVLRQRTLAWGPGVSSWGRFLLPLELLGTEGLYESTEVPSSLLSIDLGEPLLTGGELFGGPQMMGKGEQCSGVNRRDPPCLLLPSLLGRA
jgi:hypothetical protein